MDYADTRPSWLRQANAFSINPRKAVAQVYLHPRHIEAVLGLALKWDIVATRGYNGTEELKPVVTPGEVLGNLLGTFLDAVILGYLTPIERQYK